MPLFSRWTWDRFGLELTTASRETSEEAILNTGSEELL